MIYNCVYFIHLGYPPNADGADFIIMGMTKNFPQRYCSYKKEKSFPTSKATFSFAIKTMSPRKVETTFLRKFDAFRSDDGKEQFTVRISDVRRAAEEYCADKDNGAEFIEYPKPVKKPYDNDSVVSVNRNDGKMKKHSPKMEHRMQMIQEKIDANGGTLTVGELIKSFEHHKTDYGFNGIPLANGELRKKVPYGVADFEYDVEHANVFVTCTGM